VTAVRIPPTLRGEVGGARQVEADGQTVREVLQDLAERYPSLGAQVLDDGQIATFVNIYLGGEDVRTLDGLDTVVPTGQTVILLPAMAGGCPAPLSALGSRRAEPGSAERSRRSRHDALRGRMANTVPSGLAPRATRQERG
jgi:molybdopterin synthase sulfur carrier subunit